MFAAGQDQVRWPKELHNSVSPPVEKVVIRTVSIDKGPETYLEPCCEILGVQRQASWSLNKVDSSSAKPPAFKAPHELLLSNEGTDTSRVSEHLVEADDHGIGGW